MKIKAEKRDLTKKKTKQVQMQGKVPGAVYGPKRKSVNIMVDAHELEVLFDEAGFSSVIDIEIEGEKKAGKAIIREIQHDPITDEIIHVSFYDLDMEKKITTEVPVVVTGVSRAVKDNIGFLVTPFESLEVRCLPKDLPNRLEVDISKLDAIGDNVLISDLSLPEGVALAAEIDEHSALAYIAPPQKEIIVEEEETVAELDEEEEGLEGEEGEEGEDEETDEEGEEGEGEGEEQPEEQAE